MTFVIALKQVFSQMGDYKINKNKIIYIYYRFKISWVCNIHSTIKLLKPTGYVMHQQFNIQQLYALPTLYLCVLYLSENKQRLVALTP